MVFGLALAPFSALANAGTPLMWAGMLHLAFGNALIGVFEGLLVAWRFSLPKRKAVLLLIAANYFSAWVGGLFLRGAIVHALPLDLNNGWRWFWIMVVLTYLITLLLEWPFVAFCFRRTERWLPRSVRANVLVQTASYVVLFGWYWMASGTSLYTRLRVTSPAELSLPANVVVYFISEKDGDVYRRGLAESTATKVYTLGSRNADDRLFARPNSENRDRWDLVARLRTNESRDGKFVEVLTNLLVEATLDERATLRSPPQYEGTWFNFGEAGRLGSATNSAWKFRTGFWSIEGLTAQKSGSRERIHFSYETPFGHWTIRNAFHLPSDKVLFQLGDDQVCAFDPETRRVALLWRGRGPVPMMEKSTSGRATAELPSGTP